MHCTIPTLSPAERTTLEAMDTLTALGGTVPTSTKASMAQTQAIQNLCDILLPVLHQGTSNPIATDTSSPRVLRPRLLASPAPRVPTLGPSPRVMHTSARSIAPHQQAPQLECLPHCMTPRHLQTFDSCDLSTSNIHGAITSLPFWRTLPRTTTMIVLQTTSQYKPTTAPTVPCWVPPSQLVCQPARHSNTLMVLTDPIASPVHDL